MKTSATENENSKFENSQSQIENPDFMENKIRIDEMKENIIRELAKLTNRDMKDSDRVSLKKSKYDKNTLMQINLVNDTIEILLQTVKLNFRPLNEIIRTVAITHKQNSF